MRPDPSLQSRPHEHKRLEAGKQVVRTVANTEPEQLRDCPKDQGEEAN